MKQLFGNIPSIPTLLKRRASLQSGTSEEVREHWPKGEMPGRMDTSELPSDVELSATAKALLAFVDAAHQDSPGDIADAWDDVLSAIRMRRNIRADVALRRFTAAALEMRLARFPDACHAAFIQMDRTLRQRVEQALEVAGQTPSTGRTEMRPERATASTRGREAVTSDAPDASEAEERSRLPGRSSSVVPMPQTSARHAAEPADDLPAIDDLLARRRRRDSAK